MSSPGVGLGAASWKRQMAAMGVFGSEAHLVLKKKKKSVAVTDYLELHRVGLQQQLIWIHIS